jgi:HEAT repeat protein
MKRLVFACVCCIPAFFLATDAGGQKKKPPDDLPPPKKEDVPKLISTLKKSTNAKDRGTAADQLGRLGQIQFNYVKDAIEPLMKALQKDDDAGVRRAAAEALGKIAPDPPETTVAALIAAIKDKNLEVNLAAITALGRFGPEASSAVPAIREFSKSKGKDKKITPIVNAALKEIVGKKKG